MTAPIKPGTVAGLSPEELFGGDATEILSVRGTRHFHCLVVKQGRGLVYYAYPERFPGDFVVWSVTPQPMPAWEGEATPQTVAGACQWVLSQAMTERFPKKGADTRPTPHQRQRQRQQYGLQLFEPKQAAGPLGPKATAHE